METMGNPTTGDKTYVCSGENPGEPRKDLRYDLNAEDLLDAVANLKAAKRWSEAETMRHVKAHLVGTATRWLFRTQKESLPRNKYTTLHTNFTYGFQPAFRRAFVTSSVEEEIPTWDSISLQEGEETLEVYMERILDGLDDILERSKPRGTQLTAPH